MAVGFFFFHEFSAAGLQEPARYFLSTPLPASAAALCPYMAATGSQSERSRQLIQTASVRGEQGGNCKQKRTVLHHTKQYSTHTHTQTHTICLLALEQNRRCYNTTKQSNACKLYSAVQATGCRLQQRIKVVLWWKTERVGLVTMQRRREWRRRRRT